MERIDSMNRGLMAFTAVFLKDAGGYLGFVEELPGVNAHGATLEETRANLQRLAAIVFDEERSRSELLIEGKDVVRESFTVPFSSRLCSENSRAGIDGGIHPIGKAG